MPREFVNYRQKTVADLATICERLEKELHEALAGLDALAQERDQLKADVDKSDQISLEVMRERDEAREEARQSRLGELHAGDAAEEMRRERDGARSALTAAERLRIEDAQEHIEAAAILLCERDEAKAIANALLNRYAPQLDKALRDLAEAREIARELWDNYGRIERDFIPDWLDDNGELRLAPAGTDNSAGADGSPPDGGERAPESD